MIQILVRKENVGFIFIIEFVYTVELQWLEHLWDHEIVFETEVVRANEY